MTKIANKLSQNNDVHVICGAPVYSIQNDSESYLKLNESITVSRINGFTGNKNKLLFRFCRYIFLSTKMISKLKNEVTKEDSVLMVTNPALLVLFINKLKQKIKFKLTILCHDVFPENLLAAKVINGFTNILKIIINLFNKAYSSADNLIVVGSDMKDVFEKKLVHQKIKPNISVIRNWAELDTVFPVQRKEDYEKKIVFLFAGNMGRVQGLEKIVALLAKINNPNLLFIFQGNGAVLSKLQNYASILECNNIVFKPSYSRSQQNDVFSFCDIGMVSLLDEMYGLGVPSKTYNFLAAAKPIFFLGHPKSEISLLVKEHGIGYSFSLNDETSIISFLNSITIDQRKIFQEMGENARFIDQKDYSEELILNKIESLV
jgi:glycosyltransferase involved in cell wall biosynthesis